MIDPGFLVNTLSGMNVQSPADAQEQELLRALSARTQMAAQEAQGAQQQYQSLAGQAPPQLGALEAFVPTLAANIASVIARDPSYRERNQQNLGQQRQALLQSRAQNLQSLRDIYAQKAEAAQRSGDMEATEKFRLQHEKISKTWEQVMEQQKLAGQMERDAADREHDFALEAFRQRGRLNEIAAKPVAAGAKGTPEREMAVAAWAKALDDGTEKTTSIPFDTRNEVKAYMEANGLRITPQKVRDAMNELSSAETVVDEIANLSALVNTSGPGLGIYMQEAKNRFGAALETDSPAAMMNVLRNGMAGNLARAISAERGVLTDLDRKFATEMVPTLRNSAEVAQEKIATLRRFIAAKKERARRYYTSPSSALDGPTQKPKPPSNVIMVSADGKQRISTPVGSPAYYQRWRDGWAEIDPNEAQSAPAAPAVTKWGKDKNGNPVKVGG